MAYSGLETLFQNLGPLGASMIAGEREGIAQRDSQLAQAVQQQNIDKTAQEMRFAAEKQPVTLEGLHLANRSTEASTESTKQETRKKAVDAAIAEAGQKDTIGVNAASSASKVLTERMNQNASYQKLLDGLGGAIQGVPPAGQHAAVQSYLQASGIDPETPYIKNMTSKLATIPADKLLPTLQAEKDWAILTDKGFRQAIETANIQKSSHIEGIKLTNASNEKIAKERLAAAKELKKISGKNFVTELGKIKPENRSSMILGVLATGISPETGQEMTEVEKMFYQSMLDRDTAQINQGVAAKTAAAPLVGMVPGEGGQTTIGARPQVPMLGGTKPAEAPKLGTSANPIVLK